MSAASPSVLVVEDNPVTRKMIRFALESDGYGVIEAEDAAAALRGLAESPDLVLQDLTLPDMDGMDLLSRIRQQRPAGELPVLLLTGRTIRLDELKSRGGSFDEFLSKPMEPSRLLEAVGRHLRARTSPEHNGRSRVLVVDDEPLNLKLAAIRLRQAGYSVTTATGTREALESAKAFPPDAILSDVLMPGVDGFQLCLAVRSELRLARVPVILVSASYLADEDRQLAERMGATALVLRTPDYREAIDAIRVVMGSEPGRPAAPVEELERDHTLRVREQLDRQIEANRALAQRAALQAATLSMLSGMSDLLANPADRVLSDILVNVLIHCLDATGLSTGLLYTCEPPDELRLRAHYGLPAAEVATAAAGFGSAALLFHMIDAGQPVGLNESDADPGTARILAGIGHSSALVIPLRAGGEQNAAFLLASDSDVLAESSWLDFARGFSAQLGQAVTLGRTLSKLAESEQRYRALFEGAIEGIFQATPQGRILAANPALAKLLGYGSPDELIENVPDLGLLLYASSENHSPLDALEAAGGVSEFCVPIERRDGTKAWITLNTRAVRDSGGRVVRLEGLVHDVTERRLADEALRESQDRYRRLFRDNPMPMWAFDRSTLKIVAANEAAAEQYGYTTEELTGLDLTDLLQPEEGERMRRAARATPPGRQNAGIWKHRRKDGTTLSVDVHWNDIELAGRGLRLSVLHDVTEQHSLEEQFRQSQKMEAVGRLAGGVAHDFNNLLTVIMGFGELLLPKLPLEGDTKEFAFEMVRAAQRAALLTRQLLAFSRKQVLKLEIVDLNAVVADTDKMLRRVIGEDVILVTSLSPELGAVKADCGQIEQVLMNLAINARDAMPGGGRLTVETRNADLDEAYARDHAKVVPGPYVLLAITDTGTGMDAATKARIFEPFFTTKEKGKGTGLGLATTYGIVTQSGGNIYVYSEPGHGTTFKVYLPRVLSEAPKIAPAAVESIPSGHETILLVEDEEGVRRLARASLELEGYTVLAVDGSSAALEALATFPGPIDLLLTDVVMPGPLSSMAMVEKIVARRPAIRVLLTSGYPDQAMARHGPLDAAYGLLVKPFTSGQLLGAVRKALDGAG